MFTVKICGLTTAADARMVAAAGADCVGLNFVAGSPRRLSLEAAAAVAAALPPEVLRVGVFAGASLEEMVDVARRLGLGAIQLHGHVAGERGPIDPPELCRRLDPLPVIRAVRLDPPASGEDRLASARRWVAAAAAAGRRPAAVLVDAGLSGRGAPDRLGGTGEAVDWQALAGAEPLPVPVALAGGLTPENVALAVRTTRLRAVDVSSGVETAPGRKDPGKVAAFVAAARTALAEG